MNNFVAGFMLLVQIQGSDGEVRILPSDIYPTMGQCVYVANQLRLAITHYEFDERVVGAGCMDCSKNTHYCALDTGVNY